MDTPANAEWVASWKARIGDTRITTDPMEADYSGFNMWVNAVTAAVRADVDAVRAAMYGQEFLNLTGGGVAVMLPNDRLSKPVLIGQFIIISQTAEVKGDGWTNFLLETTNPVSDWKDLGCGMYNTETQTCVQTLCKD